MKKAYKILIITGAILLILGTIIAFSVIARNGFKMKKFENTLMRDKKTYNVTEKVNVIDVSSVFDDVKIIKTSGDFKVEFYDCDEVPTEVKREGEVLKIMQEDKREWYQHIGFDFGKDDEDCITVFIPSDYSGADEITVSNVSGDVNIKNCGALKSMTLTSVSGDIKTEDTDAEKLSAASTSGDIEIEKAKCEKAALSTTSGDVECNDFYSDTLKIETTSGDTELMRSETKDIFIKTTSGDVECGNFYSDTLKIETTSGDAELLHSDAKDISVKTISGDVKCTLESAKEFTCNSVSGDVKIPADDKNGGKCKIETTSGSITVKIS